MSFRLFRVCSVFLLLVAGGIEASAQADASTPFLTRCSVRKVDAPVRGLLASDAENIYLGTATGTLSSYHARDLGIVWRLELGGEFASEILLVGNGILVVTNPMTDGNGPQENSIIRLIGKESGVTAWSAKLAFSKRYHLGRLNGGIAAVSEQGTVVLLDAASGQVRWQVGPHGAVSAKPAFSAGRVFFGTAEKQIIAVSARDGSPLFKLPTDFVPTSISLAKNEGLLVGDERGNATLFGAQDNKPIWKFKSGAAVSSLIQIDEGILITSLDNFVYFISDYNGDVIWKRRLPGRIVEGGLIVDGFLIALIYGENSGYILDLEKGKVVETVRSLETDLINRSPVPVRDKTFALTTINSLETYAIGACTSK